MTSAEIQQFVYDFLWEKGVEHKTIVSIMGNITGESSWNPDLIEVGSGVGFGLCQWSYDRRTQLEAYGTDLLHQCNFLWSELTGENTSVTGASFQWINPPSSSVTGGTSFNCSLATFFDAGYGVDFLTTAFCYCWERPAYATNHLSDVRIPSALSFFTSMTYQGGGTTPPDNNIPDGDVYTKILATPYNINQLSSEQIIFLKKLATIDYVQPIPPPTIVGDPPIIIQPPLIHVIREVKMKYTYNHNKRQIGQNYTGKRLTFDDKTYKIKDVRNDGYIILVYSGSLCYNYVNPIYIKSKN